MFSDVYSSLPFTPTAPIVPLTAANVALPAPSARRVHLYEVLPPDVVEVLRRDGLRRIGPPPKADFQPAWVAAGEYEGIVRKAVMAGVFELRRTPADSIQGLFGLEKSDLLVRMLIDCRPANLLCWPSPNPKLPLIEVLRLLGVEPGHRLFAALLDLSNYFYALIMPEEWRSLFGLPPLVLDGELVHPVMAVCPMGASFSVFVAQLAHVYILESRSPLFRSSLRLDGPLVPLLVRAGEVASAPMIDDLVSLATTPVVANTALDEFAAVEAVDVKKEKLVHAQAGAGTRVWGQYFDPDGCIRPVPAKLLELTNATRACLARPVVATRLLLQLCGKWLWLALLHRLLLASFDPLFKQARSQRRYVQLWPSTAQLLRDLIALSPLLVVDPARLVGQLCATDASTRGGAVVLEPDFTAEDYWTFSPLVYYKGRDIQSIEYRSELGRLLAKCTFRAGFGWHWQNMAEHIGIKEMRSMFTGLRRVLLRSGPVLGRRHLFLGDNYGVVAGFTRGRSRNRIVNGILRRTSALLLASQSTVDTIWTPTVLQPADRRSRL